MRTLYVNAFLLILLGTIFLQACGSAESSTGIPAVDAAIPVKVSPVQVKEHSQPLHISGRFTTDDETTLAFKTGGILGRVRVKEGDFVRKGQLLATLDLTEIKAQVNQAMLGYEKAERDFKRAENLYKDSVATLEQYQNARTAMALAEQQLQEARFNLGFSEIRATSDGYVLKKYANAGQVVSPGASILRTNGAGKSKWIFKAGVSDKEWALLQEGDSAVIYTDAAPGKAIQARLSRKAEGVDPATGAFSIELLLDSPDKELLASGLFGKATIFPAAVSRLWAIPHEALLDANANKGYVFVTSDQKTARKVAVSIAFIDNQFVYISSGLENAPDLITTGSAYLADSSSIIVVPN